MPVRFDSGTLSALSSHESFAVWICQPRGQFLLGVAWSTPHVNGNVNPSVRWYVVQTG